jgi:hypothetical protein
MKLKITFLFLLVLSTILSLSAQKLATFEDGGVNHLRVGDYDIDGDPGWYEGSVYVEGGQPQIGANPSKSGINTSDKCVFAINVADADWWGNFFVLMLDAPVTVTESNHYLHLQVYRSIQPKDFCIGINDRNEDPGRVFEGKLSADATWENVVVDLTSKIGTEIQYISFICSTNWSDPRTGWGEAIYAFDNFELTDSPLPPGITLVDGTGMFIGFENETEIDQWIHEVDLLNPSNAASIIDNPFGAATLIGNKIVKFDKSADASWWQGYRMDFNGLMEVGNGKPNVLHVLTYVPAAVFTAEEDLMSIDIQLCAKDHLGNENTQIFTVWDDEVDKWTDLVMEITDIDYLKELTIRYDLRKNENDEHINTPANTYYFDAVAFDNSTEERTVTTDIKTVNTSFANAYSIKGKIIVDSATDAKVEVYNFMGQKIRSVSFSGSVRIPVESGVYIVKIVSLNNEQQVCKMVVR